MTSALSVPMPAPLDDRIARRIRSSRLDSPDHERFAAVPYYDLARALLLAVREHDLHGLEVLCDDDADIVDVAPSGASGVLRGRDEWLTWFGERFAALEALGIETDTEILDLRSFPGPDTGWSVMEFRRHLEVGGQTATVDGVATFVWMRTGNGWKAVRWHNSIVSSDVPFEITDLATAA